MTTPHDLESRFAIEDGMAYMASIFEDPTEEDLAQIDRVRMLLETLPPREADFLLLYYFLKLRQTDIARLFRVSQPTVCYRLRRATMRIRFRLSLPLVSQEEIEATMKSFLDEPLNIRIMTLMWETTCQSATAKILGVSQGLVRHRFLRTLKLMKTIPELADCYEMYSRIAQNLNILREVRRRSWDDRLTGLVD